MQFKTFIIPAQGNELIEEELNKFLRSHKIVEIDKKFMATDMPCWCFCIGFLTNNFTNTRTNEPKVNYETVLSKEEFSNFERLRDIRKKVAQELNIPAYAVFTNKELSELSKIESISKESLENLAGFGSGRMEKVGLYFLKHL